MKRTGMGCPPEVETVDSSEDDAMELGSPRVPETRKARSESP